MTVICKGPALVLLRLLTIILKPAESQQPVILNSIFDGLIGCNSSDTELKNSIRTSDDCGVVSSSFNFQEVASCYTNLGRTRIIDSVASGHAPSQGLCQCKKLPLRSNQFACSIGAYKDLITRVQIRLNLLYPCIYAVEYPAACYCHMWSPFNYPLRDAIILCLGITNRIHRHSCMYGVAYSYSAKYYADTGILFPIDYMCSIGTGSDKIMCIHGYWDGLQISSDMILAMKAQICRTLEASILQEVCMMQGLPSVPLDSPLFQSLPSGEFQVTELDRPLNSSQVPSFLLRGLNGTLVNEFRRRVDSSDRNIPLNVTEKYFLSIGVNAMLHVMETLPVYGGAFPFCHEEGHNLGRIVYLYYPNLESSMYICGRGCTSSCFHGALSQYFLSLYRRGESEDQGAVELRKHYDILQLYQNSSISSVFGTHVFHGVGHAIMVSIARNNFQVCTKECKTLSNPSAQYQCSGACYMEHFRIHRPNFTHTGLKPCDSMDTDFPAICHHFLWIYIAPDIALEKAIDMCLKMPYEMDRHGCFFGVGNAYMQEAWKHDRRELPLSTLCSAGDESDKKTCIQGALFWSGPYTDNVTALIPQCQSLPRDLMLTCGMLGRDKLTTSFLPLYYFTAEMRAEAKTTVRG